MNPALRIALVSIGVVFVLTVPALTKDLWTPDEPRYALVAKEMMLSGDYLVPRRNNEVYREKPPLLFWLMAAASWPVGTVTEFTARIPSLLSALATLLLTFDLARRMFGDRTGLWSALILMTTFRFWWQSNTGQIDMLLTACITFSLYSLWRWREASGRGWGVRFHAGLALGLLAKGPPALVFAAFGSAANAWANKEGRRSLRLWLGLPLALALAALWFYLSRRATAGPVADEVSGTFSRQIVDRMLSGVSHAQPPWYYLENLPADCFPWTLLLPWTAFFAWRQRREGPAMRLLLSWILPALVFFHLIAEKRALYLLPLYPPAAILVARSLLALIDEGRYAWLRASAYAWMPVSLAVAALPVLLPFTAFAGAHDDRLAALSAVGVICLLWTGLVVGAKAWRHWPVAWVAQALLLFFAIGVGAFPVVDQFKSAKAFCAPVRALAGAGPVTAFAVRLQREEYVFYSDTFHRIVLESPGAAFLDADMRSIAAALPGRMAAACEKIAIEDYTGPTAEERTALREAASAALAGAGLQSDVLARYRQAVARDVDDVLRAASGPAPAVIFVQPSDWRWILAFAEDTRFLSVLRDEVVSSRHVLLLGNPAATDTLRRLGVMSAR